MNAVFEKREKNTVHFSFELGADEFKKANQEAYLQNRGSFSIPGFRKGRVPKQIIELNYGKGIFYEEAVNILLPEAYEAAIEELEIEPVDQPVIDIDEIEEGEPILVKIEVDVVPEIELGDYKSVKVEKVEVEVTDDMIDEQLEEAREKNARLVDAGDAEIKEGNIANIDFEGSIDGEKFEGGAGDAFDLTIGEGMFIPGFEEQLIGHKKGDDLDVKVTFPEDYEESLAGKEAVFAVKINNVRYKELPELDDDFALDISEFDTIEEFRADIKSKLEEQLEDQAKTSQREDLVRKIVEDSEIDIPQGMIDAQIDEEMGQMDFRLRQQGLELGQYLEMTGSDMLGMREQIEPMAIERVKSNLVLEKIAELEEIEVTDEDIDNELKRMAEYQGAEDVDEFVKEMKAMGNLEALESGISNNKVLELLLGDK